jgi:DNA-directed RNA polymerase subunit RPC12/RpoP
MEKAAMDIKKCRDCGAEIKFPYSKEWLLLMEDSVDKREIICSHCGVSINDNKDTNKL